jgi:hypothetical protein
VNPACGGTSRRNGETIVADKTRSKLARNQRTAVGIHDFRAYAMQPYAAQGRQTGATPAGSSSSSGGTQSVVGSVTSGNDHDHHGGDGADINHAHLVNVTANQHHNQVHALAGADHSAEGLIIGQVLRAISEIAFEWAKLQHGDLEGVGTSDHHVRYSNAEAVAAIKADVDWHATNWDTAFGWGNHAGLYELLGAIATHAAIVDAHHARYTDAEAVVAVKYQGEIVTYCVPVGVTVTIGECEYLHIISDIGEYNIEGTLEINGNGVLFVEGT